MSYNVGWSRGHGCLSLASLLTDEPIAIGKQLVASCVDERLDLLVTRERSSFDLVPTLVPRAFDPDLVTEVVVAVADGPHSPFAVDIAGRLTSALGVDGSIVTVYRSDAERIDAELRLASYAEDRPLFDRRAIESPNVKGLLDSLHPGSLLVIGAPEGSWFQRQLLGPGPSLIGGAPGPAVTVRSAPRRCFHLMVPVAGRAVAPHMRVKDLLLVTQDAAIPIAEQGRLVGIVRTAAVADSPAEASVSDVMEDPVAVGVTEPFTAARDLAGFLDGGPVPVVGDKSELLGIIDLRKEEP